MNYSLRTIGEDGLAQNTLIGHDVRYMGKLHPNFQKLKLSSKIGLESEDLAGVFLHPYGHSGYTLAYNTNDYYVVSPDGSTYDSFRFLSSKIKRAKESDNQNGYAGKD